VAGGSESKTEGTHVYACLPVSGDFVAIRPGPVPPKQLEQTSILRKTADRAAVVHIANLTFFEQRLQTSVRHV